MNGKCHHISAENRQDQEHFECVQCGHADNADVNAAINILERGHRLLACGEMVVAPLNEARTTKKSKRKLANC